MIPRTNLVLSEAAALLRSLTFRGDSSAAAPPTVSTAPAVPAASPACEPTDVLPVDGGGAADFAEVETHDVDRSRTFALNAASRWPASLRWPDFQGVGR